MGDALVLQLDIFRALCDMQQGPCHRADLSNEMNSVIQGYGLSQLEGHLSKNILVIMNLPRMLETLSTYKYSLIGVTKVSCRSADTRHAEERRSYEMRRSNSNVQ